MIIPAAPVLGAVLAGAVLIVLGRVAFCLASRLGRAARTRTMPGQALSLIARPHHQCDALVVDCDSSDAACMPASQVGLGWARGSHQSCGGCF